jgi:anti-sigma factor ChrR (cupin superfamily)
VPCNSERVTAYVDRELSPILEHAVERHLAACPTCATQAVFEIELGATLAELVPEKPRPGLAARVLAAALSQPPSARC